MNKERKIAQKLNEIILVAKDEATRQYSKFKEGLTKQEDVYKRNEEYINRYIRPFLQPAPKGLYMGWLKGYLDNGGFLSGWYDRPYESATYYVAYTGLTLPALYGANSFNIIVPIGVQIRPLDPEEGFGHNELYHIDGFTTNTGVFVYNDIEF